MTVIQKPTPHKNSRANARPHMVVIHGDAGKTDEGTIAWLADPASGVSYHYLIGRNGQVYQFVDESLNAWHAGLSTWPGQGVGNSVNRTSIGVAFANSGLGETYRDAQYIAGAELLDGILRRHAIPLHLVRGHAEVSPGRKLDPWPIFDWTRFFGLVAGRARG